MTMKTKKTLQHIAAVAVVLLTLCLVFAAPVSAEVTWTMVDGVNTTIVSDVTGLVAALADVEDTDTPIGDYVINLASGTYELSTVVEGTTYNYLMISQTANKNVTLSGAGVDVTIIKGEFAINGQRRINTPETLTFTGFTLDASASTLKDSGVIYFMNGDYGYSHNVFIETCKIIGKGTSAVNGLEIPRDNGYVYDLSLKNVEIVNCNVAVGGYSKYDVIIDGCTFSNCAAGVNLQGSGTTSVTIKNSEIDVNEYALRAGTQGTAFSDLTLENNILTSKNEDDKATIIFRGTFTEGTDTVDVVDNIITGEKGLLMQDAATSNSYTLDSSFFDLSNNYWGGEEPTEEQLGGISFAANTQYYTQLDENGAIDETSSATAIGDSVAVMNGVYYDTLQNAVDAATSTAENPMVIELLGTTEVTGDGVVVPSGKHIKIDFNGLTYNVTGTLVGSSNTETNCFQLLEGSTVIMTNGKIVASAEAKKGGSGSEVGLTNKAAMLIQNYADLTLENMILDGNTLTHPSAKYALSINNGNAIITGSTQILATDDGVALDVCRYSTYDGPAVTVESGVTIDGDIEYSSSDYSAGAQHKLTINGGMFTGGLNILGEPSAEYLKGNISIYGGTFTFNPSAYIAGGMEVVQPGDKYLVQKYVDRSSSSSSSSTTEPEEPEQPEEPVVEPETPAAPGEVTVETEVTDGGEVELETPAAEGEGGSAAADEDEAKITGVVLPTGTDSEVAFVPVSEQPAPAGQEENTKKVFEINVPTYEKGKAAVIKFQMTVEELAADGKEAADVALWHFDEETGEWTKLVTSYTIVDGVVYFEAITNDFSPFAIIYEDEPVDEPVEEPETPASPAPVLGLLAALGAAVVLRRK